MAENKITIGFTFEDEIGNKYSQTSSIKEPADFGASDIDIIGEHLNIFLKQCGFTRKNDYIFMEDVTEDEYNALSEYLNEFRSQNEKGA